MSGHRQAAVALHGLIAADRAAILAELPEQDRQVLRGYLAELDELGFDGGGAALVADAPPRSGHTDPAGDALADARAADVHLVLQGEPAALVAQLLSLEPWRWRADFLALQTGARREQLRAAAPADRIAPARAAFLVEALRSRLARLPAPAAAANKPKAAVWSRKMKWPWTR